MECIDGWMEGEEMIGFLFLLSVIVILVPINKDGRARGEKKKKN